MPLSITCQHPNPRSKIVTRKFETIRHNFSTYSKFLRLIRQLEYEIRCNKKFFIGSNFRSTNVAFFHAFFYARAVPK